MALRAGRASRIPATPASWTASVQQLVDDRPIWPLDPDLHDLRTPVPAEPLGRGRKRVEVCARLQPREVLRLRTGLRHDRRARPEAYQDATGLDEFTSATALDELDEEVDVAAAMPGQRRRPQTTVTKRVATAAISAARGSHEGVWRCC